MDQIPRPVRDQARQHFQPPLLLLYLVSFRCRLWLLELAVVEMVLVVLMMNIPTVVLLVQRLRGMFMSVIALVAVVHLFIHPVDLHNQVDHS